MRFSDTERDSLVDLVDLEAPEFAEFWRGCAEHVLRVQRCAGCERHQWPPRPACRSCAGDLTWVGVEGRGELYSWTVVHLSPLAAYRDHVPYVVALVELPGADRIRLLARFVGAEDTELQIGAPLLLGFEDIAPRLSVPVWAPG